MTRVRRRWRRSDGCIGTDNAIEVITENVGTDRLRTVYALRLQGMRVKDLAALFGRDVRTINRWISEAKKQNLIPPNFLDPQIVVQDLMVDLAQQETEVRDIQRAAEQGDDLKMSLNCQKQLGTITLSKMSLFDRIGVLGQYVVPLPPSIDAEVEVTRRLRDSLARVAEIGTVTEVDSNGAEGGEDD